MKLLGISTQTTPCVGSANLAMHAMLSEKTHDALLAPDHQSSQQYV